MSKDIRVPEGYKKTDLGVIPEEWEIIKLGEFSEKIQYGYTQSSTTEAIGPKFLRITDIQNNSVNWENVPYCKCSDKDYEKYKLIDNDLVFARTGATTGKSFLIKNPPKAIFASYLIKVTPSERLNPQFVYFFFQTPQYWKQIHSNISGSTLGGVNASKLSNLKILIPSLPEQRTISSILSKIDERIERTTQIIEKTELLKKGLMQQLLTRGINNTHFKKTVIGEIPEAWNFRQIGKLVKQVRKPVYVEKELHYQEIGIRSHGKGIFHKVEITGKELGNKRVFWIEPNCLILNIVFAWERAVAATSNQEIGMIASHRFPMFRPDEDQILLSFIVLYLNSSRGANALQSVSPGGAGRNKTLNQKEFLKLPIPVPPLAEQEKIVEINNKANAYLEIEQRKLETLNKIKSGLIQDLFTGRVRVKLNEEVTV